MTDLDFDYCPAHDCEIAEYNGLTIKAQRDEMAFNPFDDWDGHLPMISTSYHYGRREFTLYDKTGSDIENPLSYFTDGQLIRQQKALCKIFDENCYWMEGHHCAGDMAEHVADYRETFDTMADCKREFFEECFRDVSDSDRLNVIEALFDIIGIPCLNTCTRGYSQGDYADVLIVHTREARKKWGIPKDGAKRGRKKPYSAQSDMKGQAKLYGSWAWGDVYLFSIEHNGETLDSCGGYYGTDHDENGLSEYAKEMADCYINAAKKRRAEKLKQLIAARAPLHIRPAELAQAGEIQA